MPELPTNLPLEKILPWAAGGLGIAALENKLVGENLPPELQNVNLGIGGVSGMLAANPAHRAQVLSSLPFKQMALFGIGAIDKLRRQQQALTDTNLATAKINQNTASMEGENASGKAKQVAAFLIPALLGSGALAYYAYNQRKKDRAKGFETVGQRGTTNREHNKVKIDVPASALPPEFFSSLVHADDTPRSRVRFMQKAATYNGGEDLGSAWRDSFLGRLTHRAEKAPNDIWNSGAGHTARDIGGLGMELTGLPTLNRTVKDVGLGFGSQSGGSEGVGNRYLAAGLGGALLSGAALKSGILPLAARMIGPGRLLRQIRPDTLGKAIRGPITGTPNLSQTLLNTISGRALTEAEHAGLANPGTRDAMFKSLHNTLGGNRHLLEKMNDLKYQFSPRAFSPGRTPTTLLGEASEAGRRGLHGAKELGRRGYYFGRRHPYLSAYGLGTPLAFMGTLRDEDKYRDLVQRTKDYMPSPPKYGPWRMPLSSQLAQMLSNVGSEGMPAVAQQVMGFPRTAYDASGLR